MNILVIDNSTTHLHDLLESLHEHKVEVQAYMPGIKFQTGGKDLVILSGGGGEGREANNTTVRGKLWYEDEIEFIRSTRLPVVGICMGFELIAKAFGSKVEQLPRMVHGFRWLVTRDDSKIKQWEAHRFGVQQVNKQQFDVMARSGQGLELIRHRTRPIIASQFHPEVEGGSWSLAFLVHQLASLEN